MTDLSLLTKLNPRIACEETRKLFYNKHLYRLRIYAENARFLTSPNYLSIEEAVTRELKTWQLRQGFWAIKRVSLLESSNFEKLECLRKIYQDYKKQVKFRIEGAYVSVYSNSIDDLNIIASRLPQEYHHCLHTISCPKNQTSQQLISKGCIISPNAADYKYKIMLRDGKWPAGTAAQIMSYLRTLGDTVKYTDSFENSLTNTNYIYGKYFYTKDISVVTFISLIHPTAVLKIHELAVVA